MQYFASFEPFEVFEEFNGVPGTYLKSFLISDKINLNKWQATHEANISNLDSFIGRPGIAYTNPDTGKLDHTGATTKEKSLQIQELYRAASIIAVGTDIATKKNWQMSKMIDDEIIEKVRTKEIKWISPSIWPKDGAVEIIESTDGTTVERVHDYEGLHYAFLTDDPAYDIDAEIKAVCNGTTKACQIELAKFNASIDNVPSITEHKIISPDSSKQPNTSHKNSSAIKTQMATEEETRKEVEELKEALKAAQEELEKRKDEEAKKSKKAQDEEDEKDKEGKKAETEKEDEEKKALKAQVEFLTAEAKKPLVEQIVSAQLSASIISPNSESKTRAKLMNASFDSLTQQYELIKPFETKLNSLTANVNVPLYGSVAQYDASYDDIDDEKLLQEVSTQ